MGKEGSYLGYRLSCSVGPLFKQHIHRNKNSLSLSEPLPMEEMKHSVDHNFATTKHS